MVLIESVEERYLRWMLGVDGRTPKCIVREELQRKKIRVRAEMTAWKYERRLEEGRGSELARLGGIEGEGYNRKDRNGLEKGENKIF